MTFAKFLRTPVFRANPVASSENNLPRFTRIQSKLKEPHPNLQKNELIPSIHGTATAGKRNSIITNTKNVSSQQRVLFSNMNKHIVTERKMKMNIKSLFLTRLLTQSRLLVKHITLCNRLAIYCLPSSRPFRNIREFAAKNILKTIEQLIQFS